MADRPHSLPVVDDFDPANQALADALGKSFVLLKWVMALVLLLYACSGLFRVKSGEVGYVIEMGNIVSRDLQPGWHWAWPFPIDEPRTMSTAGERLVTVPFMFQLSEQQRLKGLQTGTTTSLRPGRDNYLITGDLNILHAELTANYVIDNTADYLTHTLDVSPLDKNPPEYELVSQILTTSVTEVAASRSVDDVYKDREGFQGAVTKRMNEHFKELTRNDQGLGLSVRRVIATRFEGFEAIIPPLSVIAEFEAVVNNEQLKGKKISDARGAAESQLSTTAGPGYAALAAAIDAEFTAQREGSANLAALRKQTEKLLQEASGDVRGIIKRAEANRDEMAKSAAGDASAVLSMVDQFKKNPSMVMSRRIQALWQKLLSSPMISRQYVPAAIHQVRLQVPRDPTQQEKAAKAREDLEKQNQAGPGGGTSIGPRGVMQFKASMK